MNWTASRIDIQENMPENEEKQIREGTHLTLHPYIHQGRCRCCKQTWRRCKTLYRPYREVNLRRVIPIHDRPWDSQRLFRSRRCINRFRRHRGSGSSQVFQACLSVSCGSAQHLSWRTSTPTFDECIRAL